MKNRGQALVEFVMVVPILLLILCALIDFGNIMYNKYNLENDLDFISDLYRNDETSRITSYSNNKNINVDYETNGKEVTIKVSKNVKVNTPILSKILNNPYKIEIERVIYE